MADTKILVVDDEKEIADLIEIYLVSDGYKVLKADNAEAGLALLEKEEVHLVLLDIMMPGMDGLEMCKRIRETNNIPIIMLSARSTDLDKILGLGTGADDYVTKPFNPLELTARVKSQLRRYTQLNPNSSVHEVGKNEISIKEMTINKDNHKVTVEGEEIKLTPIEFDILFLLASNPGLSSRIAQVLEFPAYDGGQLWEIFQSFARAEGYALPEGAEELCDGFFSRLRQADPESFGNGREARRLFQGAVEELALRTLSAPGEGYALSLQDLEHAADRLLVRPGGERRRTIGF